MEIRKVVVVVEETHKEAGREVSPPTRKAAAIAVIKNPFAGRYEEDLSLLMEYGEKLGGMLGERAVAALGIPKERVSSATLVTGWGIEGDAHAGRWHRQVSLLAVESIEKVRKKGLKVGPGSFAENITTEGIDWVETSDRSLTSELADSLGRIAKLLESILEKLEIQK